MNKAQRIYEAQLAKKKEKALKRVTKLLAGDVWDVTLTKSSRRLPYHLRPSRVITIETVY